MRIINKRSIVEINNEKKEIEDRSNAIEFLTSELANEKVKAMQKDIIIKQQNEEIVNIKLDIMKLKGGK